jgi:histidine ammonia-lyase
METVLLGDQPLHYFQLEAIAEGKVRLAISQGAKERITASRAFLEDKTARSKHPIYGVNTGFGSLCNVEISPEQLGQLQTNLVRSHACGAGDYVQKEVIRLMLALKVESFSKGVSGIRLSVVESLVEMYNSGALPVIYQQGSLGASGDLAPLAHMSLPLLGEGEMWYEGAQYDTKEVLELLGDRGWRPCELASKEGLALLNGTQFMSAHAVYALLQGQKLDYLCDKIGALSTLAHDGRIEAFTPGVHATRPQWGQVKTAQRILSWLQPCPTMHAEKKHVQDPYSFRCMPQVHGASKNALRHAIEVVDVEINAATDNPVVLEAEDAVVSAGNFHGQPLALVLDYAALALHELGSISERRTYQLISGRRELPPFLVKNAGLNSGLMIAQYTAAGIVSQNKQYCTPASADSIESSNGQEDHVSMGANAATKLLKVVENLYSILGIELLNASQAMYLRGVEGEGELATLLQDFRKVCPVIQEDEYMHPKMEAAKAFLKSLPLSESALLL